MNIIYWLLPEFKIGKRVFVEVLLPCWLLFCQIFNPVPEPPIQQQSSLSLQMLFVVVLPDDGDMINDDGWPNDEFEDNELCRDLFVGE